MAEKVIKIPPYLRLLEVTQTRTQTGLANFLGINPASVHKALLRGTIPEDWYYEVAYKTRCRVEWLKMGEEPKYWQGRMVESLSADGQTMVALFEDELTPRGRQLLLRYAALIDRMPEVFQRLLVDLEAEARSNRRAVSPPGRSAPPPAGSVEDHRAD